MSATKRKQRLYRYVIDHDKGFAPNPFFGFCTLACCKPVIRKHAEKGDVIVGFGPKKYGLGGQIIYWMTVGEVTTFDKYWNDPRFQIKRPNMSGSFSLCFGDNIYHRCQKTGVWVQEESFHSDPESLKGKGNLRRDTASTDRVLIGSEYTYWGGKGPTPPAKFKSIVKEGRGQKYQVESPALQKAFIEWLKEMPERGFRHDPADWHHDKQIRLQLAAGGSEC